MTTDLQTPGQLLFTKLGINLDEVPIEQLSDYTAVEYYLTVEDEPPPDATNLEKVRGLLEAVHHLCEVEAWKEAVKILCISIDSPTNEQLHSQLNTWGYYREQSEIYNKFLESLENLHPYYKTIFLHNIGNIYHAFGEYRKSIEYYEQALETVEKFEDLQQKGVLLNNLGFAHFFLGHYTEAIDYYWQRLLFAWKNQDLEGEGATMNNLGLVYHAQGKYYKAIKYQERSLSILRTIGDKSGEGSVLDSLVSSYAALEEDFAKAIEYQKRHLDIARELQDRRGEGEALCNLGVTLARLKKYSEALEHLHSSIKISRTIGTRSIEAFALNSLAKIHLILGDAVLALKYCNQALIIATELGIPLAKECQDLKEKLSN